jgi:hypothetical protein
LEFRVVLAGFLTQTLWRAVRHRDHIFEARDLEGQLVALAFDDDHVFGVGNVVEPVEDRLGILDLSESLLGERAEFDVYELVLPIIRERDASNLALEHGDVVLTNEADAVALHDLGGNAALGEPPNDLDCRAFDGVFLWSHRCAAATGFWQQFLVIPLGVAAPTAVVAMPHRVGTVGIYCHRQARIVSFFTVVRTLRAGQPARARRVALQPDAVS